MKREQTGFELLRGLHRPEHRVQSVIVEGLPAIKVDDLSGILYFQLPQVVELQIFFDVLPFAFLSFLIQQLILFMDEI